MRFLSLSAALLSVAGLVSASKVVDLDSKNFDKVRSWVIRSVPSRLHPPMAGFSGRLTGS